MSKLNGWMWLVLLSSVVAWGQAVVLPERVIFPTPGPVPAGSAPLTVKAEKVTVDLRDGGATTTVEQTFHNQYNWRLEGTFLFPLPEDAAVSDFAMTVNGQLVSAELLPADKARRIYEDIVRRQKDPGLLEYLGRTAFRARIFPIEPGEDKRIKLEYTQGVIADSGLAKYVFPLRSSAFQPAPPVFRPMRDDRHPRPRPDDGPPSTQRVESLGIAVTINSRRGIKSVYSPSHEVSVQRDGEHKVIAGYEGRNVVPDTDFTLFYQLSDEMFGLNLLTSRSGGDDGYFLLLLAPKSEIREQEVQGKDIVFVIDISGSMSGERITQAKAALTYCLQHLNVKDRFNVMSFSTGVEASADELVPANEGNVKSALKFTADLQARGGTNIDEALHRALKMMPGDPARPGMVMFLTDGQPTVGETDPGRLIDGLDKANQAKARLFVFGVGGDVNTMLLDRLSDDNHGTRTYVKPGENIEVAVSSLYAKVASPVLADLRLDVKGIKVSDLQPVALPDLFRGSQLTLLGRYNGDGPAQVVLRGTANGKEVIFEYSADFPRVERDNPFIPRLWATRRIGWLLDQIRLHGQDKELVEEVVRLATRYGILTPYTSYLVLEPGVTTGVPADEPLVRADLRRQASDRVSAGRAGGALPSAAPAGSAGPVGDGAIHRSEAAKTMRSAEQAAQSGNGAVQTKIAGETTFYQLGDTWVQSTYPKDTAGWRVIKVKYGSDAWSDLLGLRKDMQQVLAVGQQLKAQFGKVLLVVGDDGLEKLGDDERRALKE